MTENLKIHESRHDRSERDGEDPRQDEDTRPKQALVQGVTPLPIT